MTANRACVGMAHILISQNSLPFRCKSEYTRDQSRFPVLARLAGARRRTSRLPERPVSATAAGLPAKDAHQSSNANALEGSQAPNSEQRYHALQPYQVSVPKRGILGSSRYAKRLRAQVVEAARDKSRSVPPVGLAYLCVSYSNILYPRTCKHVRDALLPG